MNSMKIYKWCAVVAMSAGAGMVMGYFMGREGSTMPAWIGAILIFLGAIAAGMSISTGSQKGAAESRANRDSAQTAESPTEN